MATAYEALGLAETATEEQIRAAYRRELAATHPDGATDPDERERRAARAAFLGRAFGLLSSPEARAAYDARLARKRAREAGALPVDAAAVLSGAIGGARAVLDAAEVALGQARQDPKVAAGVDLLSAALRVRRAVG